MRAMCGVKLIERKEAENLCLLDLKNTSEELAKTSGVQWYGHVLGRDNGDVLKRALNFEMAERAWATAYDVEKISGRK